MSSCLVQGDTVLLKHLPSQCIAAGAVSCGTHPTAQRRKLGAVEIQRTPVLADIIPCSLPGWRTTIWEQKVKEEKQTRFLHRFAHVRGNRLSICLTNDFDPGKQIHE